MTPLDWLTAGTALFIVGMVWLRTRMHYPRGRERLLLTRAGRIYFAVLLGVLVLGWFMAPAAAHALWPVAASTPTLARVVWFLAIYYLFIPLHRALRAQGVEVFKARVADVQENA
jgi:RsiW-degrading membrane proteinase PrsW (M82 family)